jgi:hypothetical protein
MKALCQAKPGGTASTTAAGLGIGKQTISHGMEKQSGYHESGTGRLKKADVTCISNFDLLRLSPRQVLNA